MRKEHFGPGVRIITQGEEGDKFYLLREGQVEVTQEANGAAAYIRTLGTGDFFGEAALMSGRPRSATVTAKTDTTAYSLKKADFLAAVAASAPFGEQLRQIFFKWQGMEPLGTPIS